MEEGSTDDLEIATTIEEEFLALGGISVELIAKDLQQWITAHKEDKIYIITYSKLCQGQKYEGYYLNPSGILSRMTGGQQKIVVPKCLWQEILKE